jgi:hypothetical protein
MAHRGPRRCLRPQGYEGIDWRTSNPSSEASRSGVGSGRTLEGIGGEDLQTQIVSPFPEKHLPKLWAWIQEFSHQMNNDQSPKSLEELVAANAHLNASGGKAYALMLDGVPLGTVWADNLVDGMYMGHLVFDREGLTTQEKLSFSRTAIERMFATGARKIIWHLYADNRAFRIFLKKLGAEVEGTLRQATRRNGELVDVTMMASFPESIK